MGDGYEAVGAFCEGHADLAEVRVRARLVDVLHLRAVGVEDGYGEACRLVGQRRGSAGEGLLGVGREAEGDVRVLLVAVSGGQVVEDWFLTGGCEEGQEDDGDVVFHNALVFECPCRGRNYTN